MTASIGRDHREIERVCVIENTPSTRIGSCSTARMAPSDSRQVWKRNADVDEDQEQRDGQRPMAPLLSSSPTCGPTTSSCVTCAPGSMRVQRALEPRRGHVAGLAGRGGRRIATSREEPRSAPAARGSRPRSRPRAQRVYRCRPLAGRSPRTARRR